MDRPSCQDTGIIQYYVKAGSEFPLLANIQDILRDVVLEATETAPLRHNAVEISKEKNIGNNTGERVSIINWEIVSRSKSVEVEVYMAGTGCSLTGRGNR